MKIAIISPILAPKTEDYRTGYRRRDCESIPAEFEFHYIDQGPAMILNAYDDAYAAPDLIRKTVDCESRGMDAVVINCSADTALRACREAVSIPVIGPTESTMLYASQFVDHFSVLTFSERINSRFERIAFDLGVSHRLTCVSSVEIAFEHLSGGATDVVDALYEKIAGIAEKTGCDGYILGCTDFEDVAQELSERLRQQNLNVVLFKPFEISAYQAYMSVAMGLKTGKNSYPTPQVYFQTSKGGK